jgi:hypothetical protein
VGTVEGIPGGERGMAANRHLISKLIAALEETTIRLYRRKVLLRDAGGKAVECIGWFDGDHTIEIAVRGHSSIDELVHTAIHELLHAVGYNEQEVDGGLDNAAYTSRVLREAVEKRLLEASLGLS